MNPAKKFLLILATVAIVGCIAINVAFGPPTLSRPYLDQYKVDHDHYLKIIKSDPYKLHSERPTLHVPDDPNAITSQDLAFVETYLQGDDFKAENHRITIYDYLFDFFNAALVLVLIVRFAKKPIANFLDEQIASLREKMNRAKTERQTAETRRQDAETQIELIPHEQERIDDETKAQLTRDFAVMEEDSKKNIALLERERKDRINEEELAAEKAVKRELVDQAINRIVSRYTQKTAASTNADHQSNLIGQFVRDLESKS